jgi:2-amino-4-hydroxy-6-hydroxymethyldihydropteridine diphosphokinase
MILIGIGSNLAAPGTTSPMSTVFAALAALPEARISIVLCSKWYESQPVPMSNQPWFVNGVVAVATKLKPEPLLDRLLAIEASFGRSRSVVNAARTLDLDLLAYESLSSATPKLTLPHPRLHERRFVLTPLCDIAPDWLHPLLRQTAAELLAQLPAPQQPVRPLAI